MLLAGTEDEGNAATRSEWDTPQPPQTAAMPSALSRDVCQGAGLRVHLGVHAAEPATPGGEAGSCRTDGRGLGLGRGARLH